VIWGHSLIGQQLKREFLLQLRQIKYLVNSCLFYLMLLFIFPLTLKPEIALLRTVAPGMIWMAMLLSILLSAERLFQHDYEQGVIEQWLVSGKPVHLIVSAKLFAYWVFNLLPLLILSPIVAFIFSLTGWETWILVLSLLLGSPGLFFLSALSAAFGLGINQKGALMALILFPLTLPLLIFGAGTVTIALDGFQTSANLALLLAMSLIAVSFLPYAIAAVIRASYMD
jgi:heme exporter protein B